MDEAAFVAAKVIEELFLPVAFQKHVTTLFVTTPGGTDSWFMWAVQVMHPDRPDEPIIPLRSAYRPCDKCAKAAVPTLCLHVANMRAPSKDPERERVLRLLIRDQALFVAESLGLAATQSGRIFNRDAVLRLQASAPYTGPLAPFDIIIGVDGSEGGSDKYALTAQCSLGGQHRAVRCGGLRPPHPLPFLACAVSFGFVCAMQCCIFGFICAMQCLSFVLFCAMQHRVYFFTMAPS